MKKYLLITFCLFIEIICQSESLAIRQVENKFQIFDKKNKVIGSLEYMEYQDGYYIKNIEIQKEFQNNGHASNLLQQSCKYFLSKNAKRIWLIVIPYKAKAEEQKAEFDKLVKFYKNNGFVFDSEHNSAVMVYRHAQTFQRKILAVA